MAAAADITIPQGVEDCAEAMILLRQAYAQWQEHHPG